MPLPKSPIRRVVKRKAAEMASNLVEAPSDGDDGDDEAVVKKPRQVLDEASMRAKEAVESAAALRVEETYKHHVVFQNSKWEAFLPVNTSFNPFEDFHLAHNPDRSAKNVGAFDLAIVDGPWGVNSGDDALRDNLFSATKRDQLCTALSDCLTEQGQILVMCTPWQCGEWRSSLMGCGFRCANVPIFVVFHPSSSYRRLQPTDLHSACHTVILAWRKGATGTVKNLTGQGFNCIPNTFSARSNIIEGYQPPRSHERLRGGDNKPLRVEEKSVDIMEELILRFSNVGQRVLDCFAGTASSALACLKTGRSWVGCEMDPTVFEAAEKRLKKNVRLLLNAQRLFHPQERPSSEPVVSAAGWSKFNAFLEKARKIKMVVPHIDPALSIQEQREADLKFCCDGKLMIQNSPGKGDGVFAKEPIPRGTILGFYWGDVLSADGVFEEARRTNTLPDHMDRRLNLRDLASCAGCWRLQPEINGSKASVMATVNCARGPRNSAPLVNDNCGIMCCLEIQELRRQFLALVAQDPEKAWEFGKLYALVSIRDIAAMEELLWDYGVEYWLSAEAPEGARDGDEE